jgi:very-short-patch-repair endonuclease
MIKRGSPKNPLPSRERVASGEATSRVRGRKRPRAVTPATARARNLRQSSTRAETKLWRLLRARQFEHAKFRRQVSIGTYFADFLSYELKLVIEVDGGQHADSGSDQRRDAWLVANGYPVLRFWNNDVLGNIDGVAELLSIAIAEAKLAPSPRRPARRGGATTLSREGRGQKEVAR